MQAPVGGGNSSWALPVCQTAVSTLNRRIWRVRRIVWTRACGRLGSQGVRNLCGGGGVDLFDRTTEAGLHPLKTEYCHASSGSGRVWIMKLTGLRVQQICDALSDAYPTRDALRMLLRLELDENLEEVAGGENQSVAVFNLVTWAERSGRIDELIAAARRRMPGNEALQQLGAAWGTQAAVGAAGRLTSPLAGRAEGDGPASIDLFLSYSRKDGEAMHVVQEALREAGLSVWTDEGLEPGRESWQDAIAEALTQAHAMVVLLSPNSAQSTWVKNEIGFAQTRNKRIFPVLIAGDAATAVPIGLINAQWVEGRKDLQHAVAQELLPALRRHLEGTTRPSMLPVHKVQPPSPAPPSAPVASAAKPAGRANGGQSRSMLLWIPIALLAGASGLFVVERYVMPPQPPTPTATAGPTPTSAEVGSAAGATPTLEPTATLPPDPTATVTATVTVTPDPPATATLPAPSQEPAPTQEQPPSPLPAATKTNPLDGAEYVYVPAGVFKMGSEEGDDRARADEKPQASVDAAGFWVMRTEVSNGQYRRCVEAGACTAPNNTRWNDPAYADHPVTGVTWQQANDYAAWVGGRLPTEAEWEKACRGTEGGIYPWGDAVPTADLANFFPNTGGTMPVGSYSPQGDSPYGAADMAGNVWEWTSSRPEPYPYAPGDGREDPGGEGKRVLRGGAWYLSDDFVRCASRFSFGVNYGYYDFGFRVVQPDS